MEYRGYMFKSDIEYREYAGILEIPNTRDTGILKTENR